jgi:hypothetical protein
MAHYLATVPSSLTVEALFDYMADFSHAKSWDPSVVDATTQSPGPIEKGSRFRLVVGIAGRQVPFEYEITEFERPSRVQLTSRTKTLLSVDTMTFESSASGSVLTYDADLKTRGVLRLVAPLLARGFQRLGDNARAGLQRELN